MACAADGAYVAGVVVSVAPVAVVSAAVAPQALVAIFVAVAPVAIDALVPVALVFVA